MTAQTREKSVRLLGSTNLRRTEPRMAVLSILLNAEKPLTQEQIAEALAKNAPNKVTIYRTLETFLTSGIVHKAFLHDKTWHFELADNCGKYQCHPHFTCNSCGSTQCLLDLSVPMARGLKKGFVVHRQRVQLEGLCPKCS